MYFAGRRENGGYKRLSYQTADVDRRVEPDPQLDRLLQELKLS